MTLPRHRILAPMSEPLAPPATRPIPSHGQRTLDGTVRLFAAEALVLPTGLITLALLSRGLGASGYGLFTLAASAVSWIEWSLSALFSRATNRCIAEATDWRPVGAAALRLHLVAGLIVGAAVWLLSGPAAALLGEPELAGLLRWFALEIPLFAAFQAHLAILIGLGRFRERALISASHWLVRLALVAAVVGLDLSVQGAVQAMIATTMFDLLLARWFVRPAFWPVTSAPLRRLWVYAAPLLVSAICLRLLTRLDLFVFKALDASAADAGLYGIALNMAILPNLFALSFTPLLQSSLVRAQQDSAPTHAPRLARQALRAVFWILPAACLAAGAAKPLLSLLAGPEFVSAAPYLAWLLVGAIGLVLIGVTNSIFVAFEQPQRTVWVALPTTALALVALLWAVPRWGGVGAAAVSASTAWIGGVVGIVLCRWEYQVAPPVSTVVRCITLSGIAYLLGRAAVHSSTMLIMLPVAATLIGVGLLALGELDRGERRWVAHWLRTVWQELRGAASASWGPPG